MRSPFPALKQLLSAVTWRRLGAELAVGLVFFTYNFRGFLAYAANHWAPQWLANPTFSLLRVTESALAFTGSGTAWSPLLAEWLVVGLWWYVAILFVTSLVFMKPGRLANGLSGLCVGLGSVVLLSWAGVVLFKIARFFFLVFHSISSLLGAVFHFINVLTGGVLPYLAALALVIGVLYMLRELIKPKLARYAVGALAGAGIIWLMLPVLRHVLLPLALVVAWIVAAFSVLVTAILILILILGILGALIFVVGIQGRFAIDQFRTAWAAGKGERPMALAGFSVGSAFALVLTVTAGLPEVAASIDSGWHEHAWMLNTWSPAASHLQALPDSIAHAAATIFQQGSAPVFDAVVLVLLLFTAAAGTMQRGKEVDDQWELQYSSNGRLEWRYLSRDAATAGGVLGASVLLLVLANFIAPHDS